MEYEVVEKTSQVKINGEEPKLLAKKVKLYLLDKRNFNEIILEAIRKKEEKSIPTQK